MANQKKKKKKTNIDDIIQQMELDMMRAGKIPGEEGGSLVSQMQLQRRLASMPQGGGITPLLPTSPLDLAFETLLTGMAHSEGVDPRIAIATGIAAGKVIPKLPAAARAVNIKGGSILSRRAYKKGMESASKDPMFSDIDYPREVKFVGAKDPQMGTAAGQYIPSSGMQRRHLELYPNQRKFSYEPGWIPQEKSIYLKERTLGGILSGRKSWGKDWGESILRHESRHYKQHVEGMKRMEAEGWVDPYKGARTTSIGGKKISYSPLLSKSTLPSSGTKYGYPADWHVAYSTLIKIPKPKNRYPSIPKKYINTRGQPMAPNHVHRLVKKEHGKKYADKYHKWYKKKYEKDVLSEWDMTSGKEYYTRNIEVEARIEQIASLGENSGWAFDDLVKRAGYTKKQVLDMVTDYKIAKKKYRPGRFKADAQEFRTR